MVDIFCIRSNNVTANFSYDFKYFIVAVLCVCVVKRSVVEFLGVCIVAFFQSDNLFHQRMGQMVLEIGIVSIKISHWSAYLEFFL